MKNKLITMKITGIIIAAASVLAVCSCGTTRTVASDLDTEINVGYGTVKKSELTYAVDKVNMKDAENGAYTDMYEYLRGRVAGVHVGPDNSITIRGINSINLSNEPLIMVNGTEMNDLSIINPADVKSVEVLKDGSAAIYGARGANGVILITLK